MVIYIVTCLCLILCIVLKSWIQPAVALKGNCAFSTVHADKPTPLLSFSEVNKETNKINKFKSYKLNFYGPQSHYRHGD